jgi:hypothetical protein
MINFSTKPMLRRLSQIGVLLLAVGCSLANDSYTDSSGKDGYSSFTLCSDSSIQVTSMALLCDSSGTFYYGSGKYRDSVTCKAGDKAKVTITFDVVSNLNGVEPLLTLSATGSTDLVTVYKNARLCYLGTLKATSGSSCASVGSYTLSTQFYWTGSSSSDSAAFTPYVSIGFHSSKDASKYDLGGANTKMCPGNVVTSWNKNARKTGTFETPLVAFLWSFLVLIGTIGILGMFAWYLWQRPHRSRDTFAEEYAYNEKLEDDDRKITLVGSNLGLVNF